MKTMLNVTLTEKEGKELMNVWMGMDPNDKLFLFTMECVEKFTAKMNMKNKIYSPEEMPTIVKASFRIELDDELKDILLSDETKNVFGDELYEVLLYRLIH